MPNATYAIEWDKLGEKYFETGDDHGVLYPLSNEGTYSNGVAWNGLTAVTESPEGGDATDIWADDIKYGTLRAAEKFGGTIESYTYPDEFAQCDGSAEIAPGVYMGQQKRKAFGFTYRSKVGNDVNPELGYKLHLWYGCTASPSERSYQTQNDSPDAITMSWEVDTTPVNVGTIDGVEYKPTSLITIDQTKLDAAGKTRLAALEQILYGTPASGGAEAIAPRMPLPAEVYTLMKTP